MSCSIRRFVAISAFHSQSKSKKCDKFVIFLCFLLVIWGEICTFAVIL